MGDNEDNQFVRQRTQTQTQPRQEDQEENNYSIQDWLDKMKQYVDSPPEDLIQNRSKFQHSQKVLEATLKTLLKLQRDIDRELEELKIKKKSQRSEIDKIKGKSSEIKVGLEKQQEHLRKIEAQIRKISNSYHVSDQLTKQIKEKLEDANLIKLFTLLNYVLYEEKIFDWQQFQEKSFNFDQKLDPILLHKWERQRKPIQNSPLQSQGSPQEEQKAPSPNGIDIQISPDQVEQNDAQPDKIQIQLDSIRRLSKDQIHKINEFINDANIKECQAYKEDMFKFQLIVTYLQQLLEWNELKKRENEAHKEQGLLEQEFKTEKKLKKSYKVSKLLKLLQTQQEMNSTTINKVELIISGLKQINGVKEEDQHIIRPLIKLQQIERINKNE